MKKNINSELVQKNSNSILDALINLLPGTVNIIDKDYVILKANKCDFRLQLSNVNPDEVLIGKKCYEVFMSRKSPCEFCRVKEVIDTGKTLVTYTTPDDPREFKSGKAQKIIIEPIRSGTEIIGVIEYGLDVSEIRNKENELSYARNRYVDLAEQAPVGIMTCDINGNITYVNSRVVELMNSPSREETMKVNLLTFPRLVDTGVSEVIKRCMENNISEKIDVDYESKWGKHLWMRVSIKPIVEKESVSGARIIIDDVTELIISHQIVKENEMTFKAMVENLADAIWIINEDGLVLDVNQRVVEETRYEKKDLIGSFIGEFDPNITLDEFHKVYENTIDNGYYKYIGKTYRKDGTLLDVEVNAIPFTLEGKKY